MLQRPTITMRHLVYCGLVLSAGYVSAGLSAAHAADPTGDWKVADGVANIRVAECNGSMWGAVAWEKILGGIDRNNPDVTKKSRPTLGMAILIDMKKNAKGDKWGGEVYNAKDGKMYKSTIALGDTPDELEIQGCVLGFLCGGETWTRVGPPIPSSPTNSLAKGLPPKPASTAAKMTPAPSAGAPKAPAPSATAAPKLPAGQKTAAAQPAQPADIGDICLLPEIAHGAH
ncbi:MAG: hypothetical protein JWQ94_4200 [Tardiphaga sp.]|nr:hypothetical protein [Tardiphaga sp.]